MPSTSPTNPRVRLHEVQCISPAGLHRMAYREWGDPANDRVLVCVHGLTRVSNDFDALAAALADDYRVVCPDVVGRGRSGRLADPALYQVPTYVADMVTLLARLDAGTVHWFGTSMGALIGMALAALPDSPIRRMVVNDAGPVLEGAALARIGSYVGETPTFATFEEAEANVRRIAASFGPHTDAEWRFLTEVVVRHDGDGWSRHYDPAIAVPFRNLPATDTVLWPLWDAIRCPVLAVRGERSDLLSAQTHAEMARRGPKAQLATIAGVGHAPTFLHADQIGLAEDFLLAR